VNDAVAGVVNDAVAGVFAFSNQFCLLVFLLHNNNNKAN
jgi:hypothetical protein